MATSMGWRSQPLILPGAGFMHASATKANHISPMVRCRVHVGGVHTVINPSARYREKPQTMSTKPATAISE